MKHIQLRNGIYHYRRRTPKSLVRTINTKMISKALHSNLEQAIKLGAIIDEKLDNLKSLAKFGLNTGQSAFAINDKAAKREIVPFSQLAESYLGTLSVSDGKMREYRTVAHTLGALVTEISYSELEKVKARIGKLPKRNIQKYRKMTLAELVKVNAPVEDCISHKSANEYIKIMNAIVHHAYKSELVDKDVKLKLFTIEHQARTERSTLMKPAIKQLIDSAKSIELSQAYRLLYLTGMRLSEAYKCKISTIDGVECFDLRNPTEALKNKSSYRIIPVHSELEAESALKAIKSLEPNYVSRQASKALEGANESLYSLRHSFATDLISGEVRAEIISELMGHAHKSMTLNRYAKGFPITQLQDAVEKLTLL